MKTAPLLLALAAALIASSASARTYAASADGYSVTLERPSGQALPTYYHQGSTYILGGYGDRYNIRVTNHTGRRIEAVITVDGRDAISGDQGDYKSQRGYLIDPHGSVLVEGFRQSMSNVAAFRFTSPGDSYAGRRGSAQNIGVIGVAVFPERHVRRRPVAVAPPPPPSPEPWWGFRGEAAPQKSGAAELEDVAAAEAAPQADSSSGYGGLGTRRSSRSSRPAPKRRTQNNIGTQYGEAQYSPVVEVEFKRANRRNPARILAIYYDDANGLASRGIPVYQHYSGAPSPFPGRRFAPPPQ